MEPAYLILAAIVLSLVLMQINQRLASPVLAIADRWLRWLVFAFGCALLCRDYEIVDRPFWVMAVVFFSSGFLVRRSTTGSRFPRSA